MPDQRSAVFWLNSILLRTKWRACVSGWDESKVPEPRIYTFEISHCEFHNGIDHQRRKTMAGLIRQGHFLGTKLRSLRKRNGLTLDELSARCIQVDAGGAPSVSYLSMVETGKRMPSAEMLGMLAGIFSKDARWFLDENTDVEVAPGPRQRGGLEAMPLEPAFLF